jgi:Amt family ammonium transporter
VFPCHGLGGAVGMVLTGVLAKDVGLLYGETRTFLMHMLALVLVSVFSFVGSYLLYKLVDRIVPLRVSAKHEEQGLDLSQHGETVGETALAPEAPVAAASPLPASGNGSKGSVPAMA